MLYFSPPFRPQLVCLMKPGPIPRSIEARVWYIAGWGRRVRPRWRPPMWSRERWRGWKGRRSTESLRHGARRCQCRYGGCDGAGEFAEGCGWVDAHVMSPTRDVAQDFVGLRRRGQWAGGIHALSRLGHPSLPSMTLAQLSLRLDRTHP